MERNFLFLSYVYNALRTSRPNCLCVYNNNIPHQSPNTVEMRPSPSIIVRRGVKQKKKKSRANRIKTRNCRLPFLYIEKCRYNPKNLYIYLKLRANPASCCCLLRAHTHTRDSWPGPSPGGLFLISLFFLSFFLIFLRLRSSRSEHTHNTRSEGRRYRRWEGGALHRQRGYRGARLEGGRRRRRRTKGISHKLAYDLSPARQEEKRL